MSILSPHEVGGASRSATTLPTNCNALHSVQHSNLLMQRSSIKMSNHYSSIASCASGNNGLLTTPPTSSNNNESTNWYYGAPKTSSSINPTQSTIRTNFSYAGPRNLSDILKTDKLDGKSAAEISDMWMTYHEGKEKVHGLTIDEAKGKSILARAAQCPFFLHPVFREEGHFMILSQFQTPNYFLLAFLEDYRMDPARAQPLLTISLFDDMAATKDLTLVRCDIINPGIEDDEGYKICQRLLEDYAEEDDFRNVHMFNKKPDAFDVDVFVKEKEERWNEKLGDGAIEATAESKKDIGAV